MTSIAAAWGQGVGSPLPVGTTSAVMMATVTMSAAGTAGAILVTTQGASNMDYQYVSGGTCATGATYAVGDTCMVEYTFTPQFPGARFGGVVVATSTNAVLGNTYLNGAGIGPQMSWGSGSQGFLGSGWQEPCGVAMDGAQNVFVSDDVADTVTEYFASGGYTTSTAIGSGFQAPCGLAVDGSGNLFVGDRVDHVVRKLFAAGSYAVAQTLNISPVSTLSLAVDGSGDLFIGAGYGNALQEVFAVNGTIPASPIEVSLLSGTNLEPAGVAVDGSGNVFFTNYGINPGIYEIVAGGSTTPVKLFSSADPTSLTRDSVGNLYFADDIDNTISKIVAINGTISSSSTVQVLASGLSMPYGIAAQENGNLVFGEMSGKVVHVDATTAPSLLFDTTAVGATSSDSPQTVTMTNVGNAPLVFSSGSGTSNPSITEGFTIGVSSTCPQIPSGSGSAAQQLEVNASCTEAISFTPVAPGNDLGSLDVSDNSLNAGSVVQMVRLYGVGTGAASTVPTVTSVSPASGTNAGGTTVAVTGTNFAGVTAVSFGGVAASSFTVNSLISITAVSPAGTGAVDVTVTAAGGTSATSAADVFTYVIPTQPQTITFPQPSTPAYVATSVLLAGTASSGLPVTYSVVSGPATVNGLVLTYTGVGNVVVEADQAGDATYAPASAVQQTVTTTLLSEPVGTASGTVTTVVTFRSAGTLGSVGIFTQGAAGLDFAQVAGGSCALGTTYAVGQNCTVEFRFTPTRPGQRYGGIVLSTSAGAMLANSYVYGVGVGPQIGWLPGTQTLVGSGLSQPNGVAVDGSGNAFVSSYGSGVVEIAANGTQRTIGTFGLTDDVAVDGSGNLFVIENTAVDEVMAVNGVIPASPTIVTLATGFGQLNGIALDATGNVFIANGTGSGTDGAVYELVAVNGMVPASPVQRTLVGGLGEVTGVAVDMNGDVFASDSIHDAVYEIEAVNGGIGTSPVTRALGGTFGLPSNVGLDAANDVYVTDASTGAVYEFMAVNGSVPANPVIRTVGTGIVEPQGMVVDSNGNIFIADESLAQIVKLDYADPPSLTFATTAVGSVSSDSPQTVTISNDGNASLFFTIPTSGTNASITPGFTIGSGSTCPQSTNATTTAPQLATGASCTEAISFMPEAIGVDNGQMVVTDTAVSLAQVVLLNGTGTTPTTTVLQSSQNPQGVGMSVTFTATVTSPAGTPTGSVTFMDGTTTLGNGTLAGGVATFSTSFLTMGTHTITATYTGATDFEQSSGSLTQTIGYQSVTTTSVSPEPSTYGQPVVFSVHVAGTAGSVGTPSGMVQFVYCHGATYNVTLDANGNGSYTSPPPNAISEPVSSCPYTANYLGDAYFFPSMSASTPYVVNPAASTTTVSAAPNPGYLGQIVTLTAQVVGVPSPTIGPGGVILQPGSQVATGTVQFYDGGTPIGNAVSLTAAQTASFATNALTLGAHTITAKYSGDANLSGSTSVGASETILQVGTTTTLIVAPNPGVQYEPVTMVVSVAALAGVAAPYGQVVIYDGGTPIATLIVTSVSGTVASATYTTSALAAGMHSLVAKYSVLCFAVICELDGFTPSQSLPVNLLIAPQDFTITANPPSITIQTEHHASMQLTLAAIGQFNGPIYLSCAGAVPKWVTCEFPNLPVTLTGSTPQATTTFTIDTDALLDYKSETRGVSTRVVWAGLLPVMLLGFVRRRKLRGLVVVAIVSVMAVAMTACSGQYPAHTEPGTYTVTVQASGQVVGAPAPTVHTLDVTLVVTP